MNTRAQNILLDYFCQKLGSTCDVTITGVAEVKVGDTRYSINVFCDILKLGANGKNKVIARSDLPHSLFAPNRMPTKWQEVEA